MRFRDCICSHESRLNMPERRTISGLPPDGAVSRMLFGVLVRIAATYV